MIARLESDFLLLFSIDNNIIIICVRVIKSK